MRVRPREPVGDQSPRRTSHSAHGKGEMVGAARRVRPPTAEPHMQPRVLPRGETLTPADPLFFHCNYVHRSVFFSQLDDLFWSNAGSCACNHASKRENIALKAGSSSPLVLRKLTFLIIIVLRLEIKKYVPYLYLCKSLTTKLSSNTSLLLIRIVEYETLFELSVLFTYSLQRL